jgi:hypothetical protein
VQISSQAHPLPCKRKGGQTAAKKRQKKRPWKNGGQQAAKCKSAASRPNGGQAHPLPCKRKGGQTAAKSSKKTAVEKGGKLAAD